MIDDVSNEMTPPVQMWTHPPDGTYLPRLALLDWTRLQEPTLTIFPDGGAVLEGYCTEALSPPTMDGYECVVEAVGWRWRFRGTVEMPPVTDLGERQARVPVIVTSTGPATSEAAPSGRALQT